MNNEETLTTPDIADSGNTSTEQVEVVEAHIIAVRESRGIVWVDAGWKEDDKDVHQIYKLSIAAARAMFRGRNRTGMENFNSYQDKPISIREKPDGTLQLGVHVPASSMRYGKEDEHPAHAGWVWAQTEIATDQEIEHIRRVDAAISGVAGTSR